MGRTAKTILALALALLTAGALWLTSRAVTPKEATWDEVRAEAAAGGYALITTDELAKAYPESSSKTLLIDVRQDWEYRAGHMSGAFSFPLEPTAWSRWRKAGELKALLGEDLERPLVFY